MKPNELINVNRWQPLVGRTSSGFDEPSCLRPDPDATMTFPIRNRITADSSSSTNPSFICRAMARELFSVQTVRHTGESIVDYQYNVFGVSTGLRILTPDQCPDGQLFWARHNVNAELFNTD